MAKQSPNAIRVCSKTFHLNQAQKFSFTIIFVILGIVNSVLLQKNRVTHFKVYETSET